MLCVVVLPVGRSVVLVSRRVCLLRKRSVLESEEGIIVYSIYLRLRGPCAVRMVAGLERGDRMKRLHLQVCVELKITKDHKWVTAIRQHLREHLPAPIADNYYIVVKIAPPTQTFIHLGMLLLNYGHLELELGL